jgi:hypothetical protein
MTRQRHHLHTPHNPRDHRRGLSDAGRGLVRLGAANPARSFLTRRAQPVGTALSFARSPVLEYGPMPRFSINRDQINYPGSDYSDEEREFLQAMERYQRQNHVRFPTYREVLKVAHDLGYRRPHCESEGRADA